MPPPFNDAKVGTAREAPRFALLHVQSHGRILRRGARKRTATTTPKREGGSVGVVLLPRHGKRLVVSPWTDAIVRDLISGMRRVTRRRSRSLRRDIQNVVHSVRGVYESALARVKSGSDDSWLRRALTANGFDADSHVKAHLRHPYEPRLYWDSEIPDDVLLTFTAGNDDVCFNCIHHHGAAAGLKTEHLYNHQRQTRVSLRELVTQLTVNKGDGDMTIYIIEACLNPL